ncbi:unnamed protein product [Brassica oleracea var. botrytis]|uniref:(rape) hypothetical protein n=1 Tax=Brassica napus TaxID=3708 RepID=A0A816N7C9_BRANA|nr:unnamed protein product [Brassica napus]
MEQETAASKWEGKQAVQVNGVTEEQAWSVVSDFCNVHEWFPTVDTCHRVEGTDGQTSLVRYCASNKIKDEETKWAKERLVEIDPVGRCLSYTRSLRITWGSDLTWRRSKCCQWTVEMNRMEKSVESSGRLCPILLMVGRRKTLNPTWVFVFNIWRIKWK